MNIPSIFPKLDLNQLFPFELDKFQQQAIAALDGGRSVVVCAPTGSGKTLIGEYAIARALNRGRRVFYTTPLKALSNQKFRDFRQQFGAEWVGLVTGDMSLNRDAPVLVMTTEIFRNMLYGTPIGEIGTSLIGVEAVVLDECHYMNDRQRGTVWEESIIYCPPEIQLVALSATIANSEQLTDWIGRVHGPTELIYSDFRPVPLEFHFCESKGIFPLLNRGNTEINPRLKPTRKDSRGSRYSSGQQGQSLVRAIEQLQKRDRLPALYFVYNRRDCDRAVQDADSLFLVNSAEATQLKKQVNAFLDRYPQVWSNDEIEPLIKPLYRGIASYHAELWPQWRSLVANLFNQGLVKVLFVPEILYVVSQLQRQDFLPAIYFIFSRFGCDRAVKECDLAVQELSHLTLVDTAEAAQLKAQIDDFLHRFPEAGRSGQIEPLYRGIAAHHAGILPAWKGLVEELFQQGLIKVVFATETLAAGINMPARTTVISSLSKRTDEGHRLLKPSEFLQMSGRAGRRGMDELGHVVTLQTIFEGAREAAYLATAGADPLVSQFTPSYGMVLNLLQTHSIEEAKALVERSFGLYLANLALQPQWEEIEQLKQQLTQIQAQIEVYGNLETLNRQIASYEKLTQRLKEEKRLLKLLQQQAHEGLVKEMAAAIDFASIGTVLSLKGKYVKVATPILAVLVAKVPGSGQLPYLVCLGQDNRWYVATVTDVVGLHGEIPRLRTAQDLIPPPEMPLKPGQCRSGTEETARVAHSIPQPHSTAIAPEVKTQTERLTEVQAAIEAHPVHQLDNRANAIKRATRAIELQEEIQIRQAKLEQQQSRHWEEFLDLIAILQQFDALTLDLVPTALGRIAAALRGDNELWLGLALKSGEFEQLEPHQFAAACAAIVTESPRSDSWTQLRTSAAVQTALDGLRSLRRRLFQQQYRHQVALPVWLEDGLVGLVEQWALGVEWTELCDNTSLDEGDLVRLLRRTLDFLSQVPYVPHLPERVKRTAYDAIAAIDRFPINEVVE